MTFRYFVLHGCGALTGIIFLFVKKNLIQVNCRIWSDRGEVELLDLMYFFLLKSYSIYIGKEQTCVTLTQ